VRGPLKVALVGAGYIASVHADVVLRLPETQVTAVVDPAMDRAAALARRCRDARALSHPSGLGADVSVDVAHVLTPPATHRAVAEPLLRRGIHVLLEKPMAVSEQDCQALDGAAQTGRAVVAVNHNFLWHPAFARLLADTRRGVVGAVRQVDVQFMPRLRQLASGQLGHWMFRSPLNLLLEQVVHPVSQLDALLGPLRIEAVVASEPRRLDGHAITTEWRVVGRAGRAAFHLAIDLGATSPSWQLRVVGTDGTLECDILRNLYRRYLPTPWIEACDLLVTSASPAARQILQGGGNFLGYGLSQVGRGDSADGFLTSMRDSIRQAHQDLRKPHGDGLHRGGRRVVAVVEKIAAATPSPVQPRSRGTVRAAAGRDVLLIGGTGFLGRHLAKRLSGDGHRIRVVARQVADVPPNLVDSGVDFVPADVVDDVALAAAMQPGQIVLHLAHGGGTDWPSVERYMVGGARVVAEAARLRGVAHLVYVSSIAALYLGDPATTVDDQTPLDPLPEVRSAYARGKVESERLLRSLQSSHNLPVTVVRPGLVVGPGTSPFHSGVGEFNRETHCLGWNAGDCPLPFVLVSDVVAAMGAMLDPPPSGWAAYNLVGDVRLSARAYIAALAQATGRPLRYHPRSPHTIAAVEAAKWLTKWLGGRRVPRTTLRDLRSRGLVASFVTDVVKARLDWRPVADQGAFLRDAFADVV
jgi:nucleoside-diphosphate-sugar epimerase/predicted dehydrogenase